MTEDSLWSIPLFAPLNTVARTIVRRSGVECRFHAGQTLFAPGTPPRGLFVILEGSVRIKSFGRTKAHLVHEEGRGGTLGEIPLYSGGDYPATAIAAQPTTCLLLTREHMTAILRADPAWAWVLLERLARRARGLVDRLDRNTGHAVAQRLAALILDHHESAGGQAFCFRKTQQEIAEELGTVREVIVRTLRQLRSGGIIRRDAKGRYKVTSVPLLTAMAPYHREEAR